MPGDRKQDFLVRMLNIFHFPFLSGTKHFLLMCNARPEDSGEIKFVAKHVDSVAHLAVQGVTLVVCNVSYVSC